MGNEKFFSREQRFARRQALKESISNIGKAVGATWHNRYATNARKVTSQNAGGKAVELIRSIVDKYAIPSNVKLGYSGIRRAMVSSGTIDSGVITVHAEFKSNSGVNIGIDFPVEIRNGELLEPSVFTYGGSPKVISQSAFDDVVSLNTIFDYQPSRTMYSSPFLPEVDSAVQKTKERHQKYNRGMFASSDMRNLIKKAISLRADLEIEARLPALTEYNPDDPNSVAQFKDMAQQAMAIINDPSKYNTYKPGQKKYLHDLVEMMTPQSGSQMRVQEDGGEGSDEFAQMKNELSARKAAEDGRRDEYADPDRNHGDDDCLDPAEREKDALCPGCNVVVRHNLEVKDRGGTTYDIPNGTKCCIVKDVAGDGKLYHVKFEDGLEAMVECNFIREAQKSVKTLKSPKLKSPAQPGRLCAKCNSAPCRCPGGRKKKADEELKKKTKLDWYSDVRNGHKYMVAVAFDETGSSVWIVEDTGDVYRSRHDSGDVESQSMELVDKSNSIEEGCTKAEEYAQFGKTAILSRSDLDSQNYIIKTNDAIAAYRFAFHIVGADIQALQNVVIQSNSPSIAYQFARDVIGADIQALQYVIIRSGNATMAYSFARDIPGADIQALYDVVLQSKDTDIINDFCRDILDKTVIQQENKPKLQQFQISKPQSIKSPKSQDWIDEYTGLPKKYFDKLPKISMADLVSKVRDEIKQLKGDDISDVDIYQSVSVKYGKDVVDAIFHKEAP